VVLLRGRLLALRAFNISCGYLPARAALAGPDPAAQPCAGVAASAMFPALNALLPDTILIHLVTLTALVCLSGGRREIRRRQSEGGEETVSKSDGAVAYGGFLTSRLRNRRTALLMPGMRRHRLTRTGGRHMAASWRHLFATAR
jgi:hypothetical protein